MAEIAIPLIALGGLYIASNKNNNNNNNNREGYINQQDTKQLPNTNIPVINYPVTEPVTEEDNINAYTNANQATDKYFNQELLQGKTGASVATLPNNTVSLTGETIAVDKFKHNNICNFLLSSIYII